MEKLTCPTCETSYTLGRCGVVVPKVGKSAQVSVVCVTCKETFVSEIRHDAPTRTTIPAPWYFPWRADTVVLSEPVVTVKLWP